MKLRTTKPKAKRTERSVLDMSAKAARAFFLKPESYCRLDLPPYFDFRPVMREVEKLLIAKPFASLKLKPRTCEGINYTIYSNKDGRYAWRPFQLIHPVLYVHLVNVLTEPKAWAEVQARFIEFGEQILKLLTEVLIDLGLKLNASKTTVAQPVIASAIKSDKREWMRGRQGDRNLQKHLLIIHSHGTDFPNAGSLLVALDEFYKRLVQLQSIQNVIQLISITIDIGYSSPRSFPACAAIVSKLLSMLRTKKEKLRAVERIRRRLAQLPNNGHLEVWLQRISYHVDPKLAYAERLCSLVEGKRVDLWNNSWITDATLKAKVAPETILNRRRLKAVRPIVPRTEFVVFAPY